MEKTELAGMNMLKLPEDAEDNILFSLAFAKAGLQPPEYVQKEDGYHSLLRKYLIKLLEFP